MAVLGAGIHVLDRVRDFVDSRVKPGHDDEESEGEAARAPCYAFFAPSTAPPAAAQSLKPPRL
jgi:hypothetical protein